MSKIVEFKTKQTKFKEWLQEVNKLNFENKDIESAIIIWETKDNQNKCIANHARFNCDLSNMQWFKECLCEKVKELEFDKFMREHINEYIEFIND